MSHAASRGRQLGLMVVVITIVLAAARSARAQQYSVDRRASKALTADLRKNHLPLVGAQVMTAGGNQRRLVLYGFVASELGKEDAQKKAMQYLATPGIEVINRITVRPEIANLKEPPQDVEQASPAPAQGGAAMTLDQILDEIERYGVKAAPGEGQTGSPFP